MKRTVAVLLVVVLVVAGAAAVWAATRDTDSREDGQDLPAAGPAGQGGPQQAPDPALQEFYDQDIEWQRCDDRECARIEVPLVYDDPGGERIEIALLKHAAADEDARLGSMVVNPGGPGVPGTSYADNAGFSFGKALRERFDIVGFDPRGTGDSSPVDCLTDEQLDEYIAFDPDPDTPAEVAGFTEWSRHFTNGCRERSGDLAQHVSTAETVRDMDIIRAALGEDQLTYFGASYGTKIGATYAELFPDRVGRLVLDGAVDLTLDNRELSLQQAEGFEVALTAYVENCIAEGSCYLGDSVDEGLAAIQDFLADVDEEPMEVDDRALGVGNAFYGIVAPLYNRDYWSYLDTALDSAMQGDATILMELSDLYTSRGEDGYLDNSSEAISVINCLDDPSAVPVARVPAEFPAFDKASPTFGRVFAWGLAGCRGREAGERVTEIDGSGAAPILVIGTTRDPATPMRWAVALADQLQSAVLVKRDGDGHTGYNVGNDCVDRTVEAYLLEGTVPPSDVDCPAG